MQSEKSKASQEDEKPTQKPASSNIQSQIDQATSTLDAASAYDKALREKARKDQLAAEALVSTRPTQAAGTKRKPDDSNAKEVDLDSIDCEGMRIDMTCNQVRSKIRHFLDSGEMKVAEFCNAIGVSNKSLNDFLRQNGPMKGSGSATYDSAWEFFKKREIAGLKMPKKKQETTSTSASSAVAKSGAGTKTATSAPIDVSGLELPGQWDDDVPYL